MELEFLNNQGQAVTRIATSDAIFGRAYNKALIHQIMIAYQANARSGSRQQKDRSEVRHSTKKPWRQKGTGRARAGMSSSPLWRGGGRIFPNTPDENFTHKVNKKMYRAGLCAILSQLVREDRLSIIEDFAVDAAKTKLLSHKIKEMGFNSILLITHQLEEKLALAARNLSSILIVEPHQVDPVSLVFYKKVLITKQALVAIEELLSESSDRKIQ